MMAPGLPSASAFVVNMNSSGQPRRWILTNPPGAFSTNVVNPSTQSVRYFIGTSAFSTTKTVAELNAVRASFDQWQKVPGTRLRFEEGGLAPPGTDVNTSDSTNVVFWAKTSTLVNGGLDNISGTLAVTFPRVTEQNFLQEADIVLNGVQFAWFTDFSDTESPHQFVESNVLHEIGHFIGLDHSPLGGATMFARAAAGVNTQAGLSLDEMAAARSLYPVEGIQAQAGRISGQVLIEGAPVFGAAVLAEDSDGNLAGGTVTGRNGEFDLSQLIPGEYRVRATPLDPAGNHPLARLITGADIAPAYAGAETSFLPSTSLQVSVQAGERKLVNVTVIRGAPAFRVTRLQSPTRPGENFQAVNSAVSVQPGAGAVSVGVYSPDFPDRETRLLVSGAGVETGDPLFVPDAFPGVRPMLRQIAVSLRVASDARPGLRSLQVVHGTNVAFANGFLEILPPVADHNFDGLDDRFQRRHFPLFTAPEAGPEADPDNDGLANRGEEQAGTNPQDAQSVLRIQQVKVTSQGSTIIWQSQHGKRYQVWSRSEFGSLEWARLGAPIQAAGVTTQTLDAAATNEIRFYQVQALP